MSIIKQVAKKALNYTGYEIARKKKSDYTWIKELYIKTFIDIGANIGEYSLEIRKIFPEAQIYAFEPIGECYKSLLEATSGDSLIQAYNCALGKESKKIEMHRNEHGPASSLLGMKELHLQHFDYARKTEAEVVEIKCLDDFGQNLHIVDPLMIKIDVQGYEDKVIEGGKNIISRAKLVIIESSFEELYEGQPLFDDIYLQMRELGFRYNGDNHQVKSQQDRRVLQENSVYLKI